MSLPNWKLYSCAVSGTIGAAASERSTRSPCLRVQETKQSGVERCPGLRGSHSGNDASAVAEPRAWWGTPSTGAPAEEAIMRARRFQKFTIEENDGRGSNTHR